MARHIESGRVAEAIAYRFLIERGLTAVTTNYRCRYGELDLVMRDGSLLIVAEIRYRRRLAFGGPLASISPAKERKIVKATRHFIYKYPAYRNAPVRFDVVGITGDLRSPDIHWIPGAFTMDDLTDA